MRKVIFFLMLCLLFCFCFPKTRAFAVKQKYTRSYLKKNEYVQKRNSYFQEKDLPVSNAYLQVNRQKPNVEIKYDPGQTIFQTDTDNIVCNGKNSLSCTVFDVSFSASANCETSTIILNVLETQKMTISISSQYQKGTCFFDQILKHELSHEVVYRKILSSFITKTAQDLILIYETGQKASKSCQDIQKQISQSARNASKLFSNTVATENLKLDSVQGEHVYNIEICEQKKSE